MSYAPRTRPYAHQSRYLDVAAGRPAFACFADMGTGKSKMLIDEMGMLHSDGRLSTVFITTAKGNYRTWPGEIEQHMPLSVPIAVFLWRGSLGARAREELDRVIKFPGLSIMVMNIEAVSSSRMAKTVMKAFLGRGGDRMIVVDESTLIKDEEAIRTREMVRMSRIAKYRRIATGNPSPNSPMDLWGQFLFLGQGSGALLGYNSFYAFRARYCILQSQHIGNGRTVQKPVAFRNLDELHRTIEPHTFRVRKEECLDLPPKVYEMRHVELTAEQSRVYTDIRRKAWAELEGGTVSATQVMAQMSKLHQVLCGVVIDDEGIEREIPSNRLAVLGEVLEESGEPTIVWCAYRANVRLVAAFLRRAYGPGSVVEYHGGVGPADRELAIRRFQSGEAHYLVGTPHAGGRGLTLTAARLVVYFSNSHDLELRVQSEDRAHRIGQRGSVTYVDLAVPDSLDTKIIAALRKKINVASVITGDQWKEWVI